MERRRNSVSGAMGRKEDRMIVLGWMGGWYDGGWRRENGCCVVFLRLINYLFWVGFMFKRVTMTVVVVVD